MVRLGYSGDGEEMEQINKQQCHLWLLRIKFFHLLWNQVRWVSGNGPNCTDSNPGFVPGISLVPDDQFLGVLIPLSTRCRGLASKRQQRYEK
jgi:hypothetical protein